MSQNHLEWLESPAAAFDSFFQTPATINANLIKPIRIGNLQLANNLILAPMAGVTDGSFRLLCSRLGVGFTVSELASARAIIMKNRQTISMLKFQGQTRPYAVQIFGANPEEMAEAAQVVEELNICDAIDINMGCPVPKVVKTGAGSALMKNPKLAGEILKAVAAAVSLPVTIKCRIGWSKESINVQDFVKTMLDNGTKAVAVHARTRQAGYAGQAQWEHLEGLQQLCGSIPFIANGDIASPADLEELHKQTGCSAYMIGRGCVGRPWLFSELLGHEQFNSPAVRFKIFRHHLTDMLMEHGPKAVAMFRVHLFGYLKNHPNAAKARRILCDERDPERIFMTGKNFFFDEPLTIFKETIDNLAINAD